MKVKRIRKLKRKKTYNANINRKRLRNQLRKLPNIPCDEIKKAWEQKRPIRVNLKQMGLAYDANEVIQIPKQTKKISKQNAILEKESNQEENAIPTKNYVMETLEADAKAPRERLLRIPKGQAQFLTYLIKKYNEDYEAMARDKKNHYQLTWKQIRAKIKQFKGIPKQYIEYIQNNDD